MAKYNKQHEVSIGDPGDWQLCFQWGTYIYDDNTTQTGYRFIWRRPDGKLQAARGQARIPAAEDLFQLIKLATTEGWFITAEK
ncbi:hypothetical protein [Pontibacter lucknowensis]|uniref:Uncharacterized protein n=1 Tax=Pontibacter lucknowensis TaxID=1077936 RepID=A0A1N6TIF6_9BACT|nr:hypothetical protein [Pontibacter lucknowensis]SIQ53014.1 hypothetical protein SAMN05421545_0344 [Pontibacter lucknowensis]